MEADALNLFVTPSQMLNTTTLAPAFVESTTSNPKIQSFVDDTLMNQPIVKAAFLMAYIFVFFSCVLGNSMILFVIVTNRSMRTVTNFFLANLAIADLLVGIFCVCQNAAHFVMFEHGTWPFGRILCHTYIYILHMIPNSSAGILVLLSIERFIAVLRPMLVGHLLTKSVLALCTALVWVLSATMNIPYLIAVQYMELPNRRTNEYYGICTRRFLVMGEVNVLKVVSTVNLVVWYVLPLTLLLFIYASIGLVLWRTADEAVVRTSQVGRSSAKSTTTVMTRQRDSSKYNSSQKRFHSAAVVSNSYSIGMPPNEQRQAFLTNGGHKNSAIGIQSTTGMRRSSRLSNTAVDLGPSSPTSDGTGTTTATAENGILSNGTNRSASGRKLSATFAPGTFRENDNERRGSSARRLSSTPMGGQRKLPKIELVDSRKRVIRLCAVIVLAFAVFSLPRYLYLTWTVWRETNAPRCLNCLSALIQPTTFLLLFFSSGINPILYAFLSQRFRAAISDTFNFKKRREERKEQLMMALRSHRLSEQNERYLLMSSYISNGVVNSDTNGGPEDSIVLETFPVDNNEPV